MELFFIYVTCRQSHKTLHKVNDHGDVMDHVAQLQSDIIDHVTLRLSAMINHVTLKVERDDQSCHSESRVT